MTMFSKFLSFVSRQPARVFGVAVAFVALLGAYKIDLPQTEVYGFVLAVLALVSGHTAQSIEDGKTEAALYTYPPDIAAAEDASVGAHELPVEDAPPAG